MRKYNIRKKIVSENGGATVLVFFTIFTFLIVLMGAFMSVSILRKSQIKSDIRIQEIYEENYKNVDEFYDELEEQIAKKEEEEAKKYLYKKPYIPAGFEHIGTEDWNDGYVIKEVLTGNEFVWVPCVLNQNDVKTGDSVTTFENVLLNENINQIYKRSNVTISGETETANLIKSSVGKYGGFYIARYEAGIQGTMDNDSLTTKIATDGSVLPLSKPGCGVWNYISSTDAKSLSEKMINTSDNVKSALISGEAWDTTLQWMVNTSKNKNENVGYDINTEGKGWYKDVSNDTVRHTTGYYQVNNIYDMGGNVNQWTTEISIVDGIAYHIYRGGNYRNFGNQFPAAFGNKLNDIPHYGVAFRVVLYKE